MWRQEQNIKSKNFKIFVVSSIDGVVNIAETFTTGVRDFVEVPINEAINEIERRRKKEKVGNSYYIATDDASIFEQYKEKYEIELIKIMYQ